MGGHAMMLPDSALWVDFTRAKTPLAVKQAVAPYLGSRNTFICEPIRFEVLRGERKADRLKTDTLLSVVPMLPTPASLWKDATRFGQICQDAGVTVPPLDLIIAAVAVAHGAEVVTFDSHFEAMLKVIPKLKVLRLKRP